MDWKLYALAIRLCNGLGLLVVYALQWLQGRLPLNPQGFGAVMPDAPCHTAGRLASNTKEREEERRMADIRPTVLVIDDEPQIRRFLRATLKASGYRLVEASTAQEGLAYAATPPIVSC